MSRGCIAYLNIVVRLDLSCIFMRLRTDLLFMDFKSHVMLEDSKTQPSPVNISLWLEFPFWPGESLVLVKEVVRKVNSWLPRCSFQVKGLPGVSTGTGLMNSGVVERPRKCRGKCSRGAA